MNAPSKGRILVVDDDRLVLATVAHGLAQAGYEVIDADNGDDAILLAREHRPQLALLDIRMEGKSGFDVAETLRDAYRIPFIFLSAFSDEATIAQVQALGALAYLVKPLEVGQIVPAVHEVGHTTLYPHVASWYTGANIPGKQRLFTPYAGGVGTYRRICEQVVEQNYEGFEFKRSA